MTQLALFDPGDLPPQRPPKPAPARPRWSAYKGARRPCDRCVAGHHEGTSTDPIRSASLVRTHEGERRYYCGGHGTLVRDLDAASAPRRGRRRSR